MTWHVWPVAGAIIVMLVMKPISQPLPLIPRYAILIIEDSTRLFSPAHDGPFNIPFRIELGIREVDSDRWCRGASHHSLSILISRDGAEGFHGRSPRGDSLPLHRAENILLSDESSNTGSS